MTRGMHPMLRLALLLCPSEFRRHCAQELNDDLSPERDAPLPLGLTCLNVAWTGLRLHAENCWRDVSYAVRVLAKAPVFVIVATVTIALALAVNLTTFSIVKGTLLDPLPYPHGDRLAFLSSVARGQDQSNIDYPDAHDYAVRSTTFSAIAVETPLQAALTGRGRPVELRGWSVGGAYFSILGARAQLGRLLTPADLGKRSVVISNELWRSRLSTDPRVLGKRITLDDRAYTIIGVAEPHFLNPGPGFMALTDYWLPIDPHDYATAWRGHYQYFAIGRLRDGVSLTQAQADLSRVATQLAHQYPQFDRNRGIHVRSLFDALAGQMRTMILMVYAAALLVLLIAGANIANLLLVRATARERDLVVRSALGATRKRLAMQLAIEMGLVSATGLLAGIFLASLALRAIGLSLNSLGVAYGMNVVLPGWNHVGIGAWVVLYGVAVTLVFTLATATLPAYAHGKSIASQLSGAGRAVSTARRARVRAALAICEIVLAFTVLAVAGLCLQSFVHLERAPVGFRQTNMYAITLDLPASARYSSNARLLSFYNRTVAALRAIPGVDAAAEGYAVGLGDNSSTNYSTEHAIGLHDSNGPDQYVAFNSVTPSFFHTEGIPLLAGRAFTAADAESSQPVAVVSSNFAIAHFGSIGGALSGHVSVGDSSGGGFPLRRIVGVVGAVRHSLSDPPSTEVYVPLAQVTFSGTLVAHTLRSDPRFAQEVTDAIGGVDPLLPPAQVMSFAQLRAINDLFTRLATVVFLSLAAIALLLALAGVYGVVAYSVERRTHEFGVRMSLGARASAIAGGVIREAALLGIIGIAIGTVLAALAAQGMSDILYQTSPLDPVTFAGAAVFLLSAVLLATAVPVLRATRVPPASALRYE